MLQWWVVPGAKHGELELREVVRPVPTRGQVLVDVRAAGVNRGEIIGRSALRPSTAGARSRPSGIEFAGRIELIGDGVTDWSAGDRVMGRGSACHAEYVVVDAAACMRSPTALSDTEAGAIPNVFVTAHDALVTSARITPTDAVLISAGSSGVGSAAIQIARYWGIERIVATTRSPEKSHDLQALGATSVVDTRDPNWFKPLVGSERGVDVVIDHVGGNLFSDLIRTLRVQGRYVTVGRNAGSTSGIDLDTVALNRLSLLGVTFRTRSLIEALACSQRFTEDLLSAFGQDEANGLLPVLDRTFALSELPAAHEYMLTNRQLGKVVLTR